MSRLSNKLRKMDRGYAHWCPGCGEMHVIPTSWAFDGNLDKPTFTPSVKIRWGGRPDARTCHYNLTAGMLDFQGDSTHELRGRSVLLPDLPEEELS